MDDKKRAELRTYAWNYFSLHASQRLTTFNFYLVISTLLTGGLAAALKGEFRSPWPIIPIGLMMGIFALVFHGLDRRNRKLVRNGERALKFLDEQMNLEDKGKVPHEMKLFARDDHETDSAGKVKSFWPSKLSMRYSHCSHLVFLTFGSVGVGSAFFVACLVIFKCLTSR